LNFKVYSRVVCLWPKPPSQAAERLAGLSLGEVRSRVRQICKEVLQFLGREKKWWLIPLLLTFLLLAALVFFTRGSAPLSPYMYSH